MDTEIDWARELDASFGSGDDVAVGHYVAVGHRAVRRRRATLAAAGVAAAIVVGTTWVLAPGGAPRSDDAPVATEPSATSSPTSSPTSTAPEPVAALPWRRSDPPARSGPDGLEIRPGAVVHERRDDLFPGKDTESVALDVSYEGKRWWMTLEWDDSSGGMSSSRPEDGLFDSFDAFVRAEVAGGGMTSRPSSSDDEAFGGLVEWDGGTVRPRQGVVVEHEVRDPMGSDDDSIGLVLSKGGETTWMLVILSPSGAFASWDKASDSGWSTFSQWLGDQVAMQSGGTSPTLVALGDDGTVTPAQSGVEVLEQQADPDLQAYGTAAQGAVSAVALVEWNGTRWFVFALGGNGPDSVTPVAVDKAGGARTLDEFVAFMADKADEGGMR